MPQSTEKPFWVVTFATARTVVIFTAPKKPRPAIWNVKANDNKAAA